MLSLPSSTICKYLCTFQNRILQRQKGFLCALALSLMAEKAGGIDYRTIHVSKGLPFFFFFNIFSGLIVLTVCIFCNIGGFGEFEFYKPLIDYII